MKLKNALFTLFVIDKQPGEAAETADELLEEEDRRIYCSRCREPVTRTREEIQVQCSFEHTFTNAFGYVYRIGCFRSAAGCVPAGVPTDEYTWFAGFYWQFALCLGCHTHLGWYYTAGDDTFFGLILDHLIFGRNA